MAKLAGDQLLDIISISMEKASVDGQPFLKALSDGHVYDCAIVDNKQLLTTDFGPLVGEDFRTAGRIASLNALSDIYVNGGMPKYAMVIMVLANEMSLEDGSNLLAGILEVCSQERVAICGGHTIRGEEPIVGLSVIGELFSDRIINKEGSMEGDRIWISKPLGTGLALRGYSNNLLSHTGYDEAISVMLESNGIVTHKALSVSDGLHAMTDVTGFGLLGSLIEMLTPSQGAVLRKKNIPLLQSVFNLDPALSLSRYILNNYHYANSLKNVELSFDDIASLSVFDPQTNGPVLVIADKKVKLNEIDGQFRCIGEVVNSNEITLV